MIAKLLFVLMVTLVIGVNSEENRVIHFVSRSKPQENHRDTTNTTLKEITTTNNPNEETKEEPKVWFKLPPTYPNDKYRNALANFTDKVQPKHFIQRSTPKCIHGHSKGDLCENDEEYDSTVRDQFDKALKKKIGIRNFLSTDIMLEEPLVVISTRFRSDIVDDDPICPSRDTVIFPQRGRTKNDQWVFVLNHGEMRQGVRFQECANSTHLPYRRDENCSVNPSGFQSYCRQRFIYKNMFTLDESGTDILTESILIPSCCVCSTKKIRSRIGDFSRNRNKNQSGKNHTTVKTEDKEINVTSNANEKVEEESKVWFKLPPEISNEKNNEEFKVLFKLPSKNSDDKIKTESKVWFKLPPKDPIEEHRDDSADPGTPKTKIFMQRETPKCLKGISNRELCENDEEYDFTVRSRFDRALKNKIGENNFISTYNMIEGLNNTFYYGPSDIFSNRSPHKCEESLCPSRERVIYPKRGKTKNDKWAFLLNHGKAKQSIKFQECIDASNINETDRNKNSCSVNEDNEFRSTCQQNYVYLTMFAIDDSGNEIVTEDILIPTCCVCVQESLFQIGDFRRNN